MPVFAAAALWPALEDDPVGPMTLAIARLWTPALILGCVWEARGVSRVMERSVAQVALLLVGGRQAGMDG